MGGFLIYIFIKPAISLIKTVCNFMPLERKMYNVARKTTGYADAGSYDNDDSNGCSREYFIYNQKIPFITIEVGSVATPIPQKYYGSIFNKNKLVMLRVAQIL